jgi:hypothetical protein
MGDELQKLPTTRGGVSHDDPSHIQILSNMFGTEKAVEIEKVCTTNKDIIIAGILFLIVSLPPVSSVIVKIYKNAENPWIMALVKSIIFMVVFFLMVNSKLAQR